MVLALVDTPCAGIRRDFHRRENGQIKNRVHVVPHRLKRDRMRDSLNLNQLATRQGEAKPLRKSKRIGSRGQQRQKLCYQVTKREKRAERSDDMKITERQDRTERERDEGAINKAPKKLEQKASPRER